MQQFQSYRLCLGGHRPSRSELVFPHKRGLLQTEILLSFIGCLVSDDPTGEEAGCGDPGLAWLHLVWGCEVMTNSLKQHWRWLVVEKLTLNSLATVLVDIPAVSMPIVRSLNLRHLWHFCGAKLHILEAFGPPHKVHLCNDHVLISFLLCHTYQVDGLSWQRRNAH